MSVSSDTFRAVLDRRNATLGTRVWRRGTYRRLKADARGAVAPTSHCPYRRYLWHAAGEPAPPAIGVPGYSLRLLTALLDKPSSRSHHRVGREGVCGPRGSSEQLVFSSVSAHRLPKVKARSTRPWARAPGS